MDIEKTKKQQQQLTKSAEIISYQETKYNNENITTGEKVEGKRTRG